MSSVRDEEFMTKYSISKIFSSIWIWTNKKTFIYRELSLYRLANCAAAGISLGILNKTLLLSL